MSWVRDEFWQRHYGRSLCRYIKVQVGNLKFKMRLFIKGHIHKVPALYSERGSTNFLNFLIQIVTFGVNVYVLYGWPLRLIGDRPDNTLNPLGAWLVSSFNYGDEWWRLGCMCAFGPGGSGLIYLLISH